MTVVCAMVDVNNSVWMVSDSCVSYGTSNLQTTHQDIKMKQFGDMLFGFSGDVRFIQIICNHFKPSKKPRKMSEEDYILKFIPIEMKKCYMKHVLHPLDATNSTTLIGYKGKLYMIVENWAALLIEEKFHAIGSGDRVALGALSAYSTLHNTTPE
jgi:ATP-dependent protease HslVU (ClpYQ) peptidase subunit